MDLKQFKLDFKQVIKSIRIKSLFVYVLIMSGITGVMKTLQKDTIVSLGVTAMEYSYIFAILTFCVGIGSKLQYVIEKQTKRKNLTYIGYIYTALLAFIGIVVLVFKEKVEISLIIVIAALIVHNIAQGVYRISVKKYMNNFTTHRIRGKVLSIFYICEGVGQAVLLAVCGLITDLTNTNITLIVTGSLTMIGTYFILKYMKKHFGLDPEMYTSEDIWGVEITEKKKPEDKELKVGEALQEIKDK